MANWRKWEDINLQTEARWTAEFAHEELGDLSRDKVFGISSLGSPAMSRHDPPLHWQPLLSNFCFSSPTSSKWVLLQPPGPSEMSLAI